MFRLITAPKCLARTTLASGRGIVPGISMGFVSRSGPRSAPSYVIPPRGGSCGTGIPFNSKMGYVIPRRGGGCGTASDTGLLFNSKMGQVANLSANTNANLSGNIKHPDSMPRYPEASIPGLLRLSDYLGTAAFACTGAVTAGVVADMDLLGCLLVGTVTAVGGGTIRDLLIGQVPFWTSEQEYLWISLGTAGLTFLFWQASGLKDDDPILVWMDALGVGAFCVIGTMNGIRRGLPALVCAACGMFTATGGGVVRDVLSQRKPRILHSYAELYASTALFGSSVYLMARRIGAPVPIRIAAGAGSAIVARWASWTRDIRLPTWSSINGKPTSTS